MIRPLRIISTLPEGSSQSFLAAFFFTCARADTVLAIRTCSRLATIAPRRPAPRLPTSTFSTKTGEGSEQSPVVILRKVSGISRLVVCISESGVGIAESDRIEQRIASLHNGWKLAGNAAQHDGWCRPTSDECTPAQGNLGVYWVIQRELAGPSGSGQNLHANVRGGTSDAKRARTRRGIIQTWYA